MSWKFLSYPLNDKAFGYGNGERFKLNAVRSICCGDTSNNSAFSMPSHYGTHIDFPFHFSDHGKKSSDFEASDFVFDHVGVSVLNQAIPVHDFLIKNENLAVEHLEKNIELLIIKTGFCAKRYTDEYWERGYGFHKETAAFLKNKFPALLCIAFDLISLNSYQNRPAGREAHLEFLMTQNILIVEDVDLNTIQSDTKIKQIVIAPLHIENADGAPCTILADINEN
ncbi:MAG: cyclase family protein [Crocinitomicaceae bacterium]|nr:cyclase family protein [Crocinitomicaceae bacterium]